ncbi:alpha-amylase family glycosyl hydrolase [Neobacillus terrae]|uniref:alpha-amylase family glycosyl hydrolase n=1 Tax=Neobacillus terrae TaxID=3034837 RepID=UPI001408BD44|nr:alpha-amylase family glycosyl hydrolase [Neobacillus terrae]NHM33686.1 alpha-amylase [Neobacillus terrae]
MVKKLSALALVLVLFLSSLPVQAAEKKQDRKWQDETVYFLMVDRFNDGDTKNDMNVNTLDPLAYHGGDFQGIIDKLDYLKDMGFTAIWMTPIFDNEDPGYHGYWIKNFYKPDEHFGSMATFQKLVKEAHKRGIKVILDFVANHVGKNNPWVNDPSKKDWFHEQKDIANWNDQKELENGWLYGLPDLNTENPKVEKYLIDAATWWIKKTDIDGYRLDTVRHVPTAFWSDFSKAVKKQKKDFYLLGEVWSNDPNYIAKYDKAGIDGFVDYPLNDHLRTAFAKPDQTLSWLFSDWERNKKIYEDPYLMGNFMDNHDTPRFTRDIVKYRQNPGSQWKMALTYLYTAPGIPIVYYGSEIALNGGNDPDNRRQMNFRADKELIDYITKIGELRQQLPSLTRGTMEKLYEENGMAVYKRKYKKETTVVAINNTSKSQTVTLKGNQLAEGKELRGLLGGDVVKSKDGSYTIILDRATAEIYVLADKTGLNYPLIISVAAVWAAFAVFIFLIVKRKRATKQ